MKKKSVWYLGVTVCLVAVLLWLLSALLQPKFMTDVKEGALIAEYYQDKSQHDVVFIGDCEVYENISPVTLWQHNGIPAYIRGSAQQLIWQSYYLMEETFRYETPKVMVFNVLSMKYDTPQSTGDSSQREAYNRMTLDGMKWSSSKWRSIEASMTETERKAGGIWNYLFPLLRYHDRWSELSGDDVKYLFSRDIVSDNGYLMQVGVKPVGDPYPKKPLADYRFSDTCYGYLDKMVELCEKNGTQLVLMKAPSLSPVWYDEWEEQIQEYAKKHGLLYLNFLTCQEEIGLDWNTDTYDRGLHLNVYGTEKLSAYLGDILQQRCNLPDRRSETELASVWEEKTAVYEARKQQMKAIRDATTSPKEDGTT